MLRQDSPCWMLSAAIVKQVGWDTLHFVKFPTQVASIHFYTCVEKGMLKVFCICESKNVRPMA